MYYKTLLFVVSIILFGATIHIQAQTFPASPSWNIQEPWKKNQLMQPSDLASLLRNPKMKKPLIFNIGVMEDIKGARNMGASSEKENLERFKKVLKTLPKTSFLVVYCGCCPFNKCPNIRPAINTLNEMGFTNARLLNLPENIKIDWKDKGYPLAP
ncbi:MAG: rhodanese-like domain-containing protein [Flavobacterium sp.]|nr:rhodanese-like domain-containing protein [Pedobacter sp.]